MNQGIRKRPEGRKVNQRRRGSEPGRMPGKTGDKERLFTSVAESMTSKPNKTTGKAPVSWGLSLENKA
jgi:hypothetical protein